MPSASSRSEESAEPAAPAALTPTLRRFNRTYTQRIGVLDDSYLGTGRPLNVSRLLFEIGSSSAGAGDGPTVRDLRERLDLDSGYLARLIGRLRDDGLVELHTDPLDRRRRLVRLTAAGRSARAELDARSEELADRLVGSLTPRQRSRLEHALAEADLLVRAATVHLREVSPDDDAARGALARYAAELDDRFPGGFDLGTGREELGARYVVATSDGEAVAYGGFRPVTLPDGGAAEIKRMWVDTGWRGAGLGARMLRHLERLAAADGFGRVVLDTNGTLTEAVALYERAGYRRVARYNDNPYAQLFFEKDLATSSGLDAARGTA